MKNKYSLLIVCWCMLTASSIWGQVNQIVNPQFHNWSCGDGPGHACDTFDGCLLGWYIIHGTPNQVSTKCDAPPGYPTYPDYHVQMVCMPDRSEGILQRVNLSPGCYKLFIRAKVADIDPSTLLNLRVSLDHGVERHDVVLNCQEPPPTTANTTIIYDNLVIHSGAWIQKEIDFSITEDTDFLDQLMITGLTVGGNAVLHVDCVYLYAVCDEGLDFTASGTTQFDIADDTYSSCTYIDIDSSPNAQITADGNVSMFAGDYIRIRDNFRAQPFYRAAIADACKYVTTKIDPPPCDCKDSSDWPGGKGGPRGHIDELNQIETPAIYPNPAQDHFQIAIPEGLHEILVVDAKGAVIYKEQQRGAVFINTSSWSRGIYMVSVTNISSSEITTSKLIVQ